MTWTEPMKWSVGSKPTASQLNQYLGGNLGYVQNKQLFSAHASASVAYTATSSAWQAIAFNTVDTDIGGPGGSAWTTGGTVWTLWQPGWWFFDICVGVAPALANVDVFLGVRNNTANQFIFMESQFIESGARTMNLSGVGYFNFALGSSNTVSVIMTPNDTTAGFGAVTVQNGVTALPPLFSGFWLREP